MMKATLVLGVVLAAALAADGASLADGNTSGFVRFGEREEGDYYLSGFTHRLDPTNSFTTHNIRHTLVPGSVISAVEAVEVGPPQFTSVALIEGGPGGNFVFIQLRNAFGFGIHQTVSYYGTRTATIASDAEDLESSYANGEVKFIDIQD